MSNTVYDSWEALYSACDGCTRCPLCEKRNNIVIGEGDKNASIMLIGEGPGANEDKMGIPFVGQAGKLMNMALTGLGIPRKTLYIANIVKCRPPGNRTPVSAEMTACLPFLKSQVFLVKPKVIILMGNTALKAILGSEYRITASRGKWVKKDDIMFIPTFHPAALLRDESKKILFWQDLKAARDKSAEINANLKHQSQN